MNIVSWSLSPTERYTEVQKKGSYVQLKVCFSIIDQLALLYHPSHHGGFVHSAFAITRQLLA